MPLIVLLYFLLAQTCFGHYYAPSSGALDLACIPDTSPTQPYLTSNLQQTKYETTKEVVKFIGVSS